SDGLTSTAIRVAPGTSWRRSSNRFAANSVAKKLIPVRLPPGRARLVTRPSLTGSSDTTKTTGMIVVAALAANVDGIVPAAITATRRRTRSRQFWQAFILIVGPRGLDGHGLALDEARFF